MSDNNFPAQHHEASRGVKSWFNFFKSYYFQAIVMPRLAHRFTLIGTFMLTYGCAGLFGDGKLTFVEQWFIAFGSVLFVVGSWFHLTLHRRRKRQQAAGVR